MLFCDLCTICNKLIFVFQVAKVITPKRSQTIGILLSSLRIDMSEIEHGELAPYTTL